MIQITLPDPTKSSINNFSRTCFYCSHKAHIHQRKIRGIKDLRIDEVEQIRLKCPNCNKTWNIYAQGVRANSARTIHSVFLGAFLYALGAPHDAVALIMQVIAFKAITSKPTNWRDVQKLGTFMKIKKLFASNTKPEISGVDGTYVKIKGKSGCVEMINNMEDGTTLSVSLTNEKDEEELRKLFFDLAEELNMKEMYILVGDDNPAHSKLVDSLNGLNTDNKKLSRHMIKQGLCITHAKKNVTKALNKYLKKKERPPPEEKNLIKKLEEIRDSDFAPIYLEWLRLMSVQPWVKKIDVLGNLINRLYIKYDKLSLHHSIEKVPSTNNGSERNFIKPKVRYKSTRGLKSKEGCLNFFRSMLFWEQGELNQDFYNFM